MLIRLLKPKNEVVYLSLPEYEQNIIMETILPEKNLPICFIFMQTLPLTNQTTILELQQGWQLLLKIKAMQWNNPIRIKMVHFYESKCSFSALRKRIHLNFYVLKCERDGIMGFSKMWFKYKIMLDKGVSICFRRESSLLKITKERAGGRSYTIVV